MKTYRPPQWWRSVEVPHASLPQSVALLDVGPPGGQRGSVERSGPCCLPPPRSYQISLLHLPLAHMLCVLVLKVEPVLLGNFLFS
jgi:hypothetical protein